MARTLEQTRYWQRQPQPARTVVVNMEARMAQEGHAARMMAEMHSNLLAEGWVYDPELRHYTHPDRPDDLIMNG